MSDYPPADGPDGDDEPYSVHPDAPTTEGGQPVHPEEGHPVCGANKSTKSTPAPHGRSRPDIPYCLQYAGKGTEHVGNGRCDRHGGASNGAPTGEANGNFQHGAFSKVLEGTISDDERALMQEFSEATADPHSEEAREVIQKAASLALIKFVRSNNPKFLAEYRQLCSEFNLVDATQHVAHGDSESWYDRLEAAEDSVDPSTVDVDEREDTPHSTTDVVDALEKADAESSDDDDDDDDDDGGIEIPPGDL